MLLVKEQRNLNWSISEVIFMASSFLKVSCRDCGAEVVVFSKATSVIPCSVCGATLTAPSGGKADLVGCTVIEALE
jgi:small subunit ribosomal protein S27e